ncbi:hypothetical protein L195_g033158, partial [Trifolium pratense]
MRERGRERERGAAPRAHLGQPLRSPPSPEARQIRGDAIVDSGEWTEVRRRRRNGCRKEGGGRDRSRFSRQFHHSRSISTPRYKGFNDHHGDPDHYKPDRIQSRRTQTHYSSERRDLSRSESFQYHRYPSRSRSAQGWRQRDRTFVQQVHNQSRRVNLHHSRKRCVYNTHLHQRSASVSTLRMRSRSVTGRQQRNRVFDHRSDVQCVRNSYDLRRFKSRSVSVHRRRNRKSLGERQNAEVKENSRRFLFGRNSDLKQDEVVDGGCLEVEEDSRSLLFGRNSDRKQDEIVDGGFLKSSHGKVVEGVVQAVESNKQEDGGVLKAGQSRGDDIVLGSDLKRASVAMFERNDTSAGRRREANKAGPEKAGGPRLNNGKQDSLRLKKQNVGDRKGVNDPRA